MESLQTSVPDTRVRRLFELWQPNRFGAAPGKPIVPTYPSALSGAAGRETSFSAPFVSGAAGADAKLAARYQ